MNIASIRQRSSKAAATVPRSLARRSPSPAISPQSYPVPTIARCACGGGCPRCKNTLPIQTKLTVSERGDAYEKEADQIAEQVMQKKSAPCSCGGTCPKCAAEEKYLPQRKTTPASSESGLSVSENFVSELGLGQPLDRATRAFFEPRFGYDFSQVRIHTDVPAAESVRAVSARAYTVGQDVVFGVGQYTPNSVEGRRLLAHELTHVVQQRSVSNYSGGLSVSEPGDRAGREADVATEALEQGQGAQLGNIPSTGPVLARRMDFEELGLAPPDFESTQPASSVFLCNPENNEGFPLVCGKTLSTRARDAVGFAQKRLDFVVNERIFPCIDNPLCLKDIPLENLEFMVEQLKKLMECGLPLVVDCKCGPCTEAATRLFQAFVFDDPREWDGIIGPKTWGILNFMATNPPIPGRPRPIFL
jgi:hypothetical protein